MEMVDWALLKEWLVLVLFLGKKTTLPCLLSKRIEGEGGGGGGRMGVEGGEREEEEGEGNKEGVDGDGGLGSAQGVASASVGKGRAFYAADDVVVVVHDINNGYWNSSASVFRKEYRLFYLMATYCIPQVSILNGIVMGAGTGFSIHGSFRVATENFILLLFVFAMPETALGLFPNIGSSYFLSRIPGFLGEYLGLTSARLDGAEMLACGLATHFVSSAELLSLEAALHSVDSSDQPKISAVIGEYSELPMLKEQSAYNRLDVINRCFSRRTVEDILYALEQEATNEVDDWIQASLRSLKKASPISLKISLRSWEPTRMGLVTDKMVDVYFSKVDDEDWEELKLPPRPNLPASAFAKL
ncbi:3-hydroxyisobutyryl-CoA hydrolase 1-like [Eucalyptus grandis]|uniref:3-hydroxyisobutyryl-CoA hydrolase 1-like n=1 Tax=Eucalyptus grandis TaxID=71139 RepID=UPI00192EDE4C|nr:3-hydroxyisobutyryl-CoA hydrolase 1-like [Eucalyptus grandis]